MKKLDLKKVLVSLAVMSMIWVMTGCNQSGQDALSDRKLILKQDEKSKKKGYVDEQGKKVISFKYTQARDFQDGLAAVYLKGSWFYINKAGKKVGNFKYEEAESFSDGLAKVKLKDKYGFVDKTGREIIPCKYEKIDLFSDGLAKVKSDGKYGFVDKTGREIIPCKYEEFDSFYDDLAKVKSDGKYGFMDKTGKEVISCKYEDARNFSDGLAKVKMNDKWGYIDKTNKEVIPCKYEEVGNFNGDVVAVKLNGKAIFLDRRGEKPEILAGKIYINIKTVYSSDGRTEKVNGKEVLVATGQTSHIEFTDVRTEVSLEYNKLVINGKKVLRTEITNVNQTKGVEFVLEQRGNFRSGVFRSDHSMANYRLEKGVLSITN